MSKRFSIIGVFILSLMLGFVGQTVNAADKSAAGNDSLIVRYNPLQAVLSISGSIGDLDSLKKYRSAPIDLSMYNKKWSGVRLVMAIDTGYGYPTGDTAKLVVWRYLNENISLRIDSVSLKQGFINTTFTAITDTSAIGLVYFTIEGNNAAKFNRRVSFEIIPQEMTIYQGYEAFLQRLREDLEDKRRTKNR